MSKLVIRLSVIAAVVIFSGAAWGQMHISGQLSGVLEDTTYYVTDDIRVEIGESLVIEAGAELLFYNGTSFTIEGYLNAAGTAQDSIVFIPLEPGYSTWHGLTFTANAPDSCRMEYCTISGSISLGLDCLSCSPFFANCTIADNSLDNFGGGIHLYGNSPIFIDCRFENNYSGWGGGAAALEFASPQFINCIFTGNEGGAGGAVYIHEQQYPAYFENCLFTGNQGEHGGAVYVYDEAHAAFLNCSFISNTAEDYAGAVFCYDRSFVSIDSCIFGDNYSIAGGAVYLENSHTSIDNSVFTENSAANGGALVADGLNPSISGCVFSGNIADSLGGAVMCENITTLTINKCTLSANSAFRGGGIYCATSSIPIILNTIIEGTLSGGGIHFQPDLEAAITYSDFFNNGETDFTGAVPPFIGNLVMTNVNGDSCDLFMNIFLNPLFFTTTGDSAYYLTENSPCIDAGDPFQPLDPDSTVSDIGAYYYDQSVSITNSTFNLSPLTFNLDAPRPNPFNAKTVISFELRAASFVELVVYDVLGREVEVLRAGDWGMGKHTVMWDASNQASGLYFVRLTVDGEQSMVRKVALVK